jgi:hypothetical protein
MASLQPPAQERDLTDEHRRQQRDPRNDPREARFYQNEGRRRRPRSDDFER